MEMFVPVSTFERLPQLSAALYSVFNSFLSRIMLIFVVIISFCNLCYFNI